MFAPFTVTEPLRIRRNGVWYEVEINVPTQIRGECTYLQAMTNDGRTKFENSHGNKADRAIQINHVMNETKFYQKNDVDYLIFMDLSIHYKSCGGSVKASDWPTAFLGRIAVGRKHIFSIICTVFLALYLILGTPFTWGGCADVHGNNRVPIYRCPGDPNRHTVLVPPSGPMASGSLMSDHQRCLRQWAGRPGWINSRMIPPAGRRAVSLNQRSQR